MTAVYLFSSDFPEAIDRGRASERRRTEEVSAETAPAVRGEAPLLARLRVGDESAFTELFAAHTADMYRVAAALLGSYDAAADVVQSVMYQLWLQRDRLTVRGAIGAYLRVATVNAARNVLRGDGRRHAWAERAAVTLTETAGPVGEEQDDLQDRRIAVLERAIAELPERTREIFLLWWSGELSYHEIAQAMGISVKGVERARARALDALRHTLIAAGLGPPSAP